MYTGQEYDDEISGAELYNLRARYYDPEIGRFMSEDPIRRYVAATPQSQNTYIYANNNPINMTDITGHQCVYTLCQSTPQKTTNTYLDDEKSWGFQGIYKNFPFGELPYSEVGENASFEGGLFCRWLVPYKTVTYTTYQKWFEYVCYDECTGWTTQKTDIRQMSQKKR